jgi:hypothetical protein
MKDDRGWGAVQAKIGVPELIRAPKRKKNESGRGGQRSTVIGLRSAIKRQISRYSHGSGHYGILKARQSLYPHFGQSKVRLSKPGFPGSERVKAIGAEHFGQLSRRERA